ncbi:hypothetical protein BCR42DRAFT_26127 [Absidia repens]|uniref:Uncharacterized protein n=1 Tax=Absidia repens TaxID=90262 RepID=A0A1X2IIG1_9FUNG|nr:hypothetical protein BCR42DRAFT_26127 [Absidia repens]
MNRQRATSEIQIADMNQQINELRILLVEATISSQSYRFALNDMEYQTTHEKLLNKKLYKRHEDDVLYIETLENQINALEIKMKDLESDNDVNRVTLEEQHKKWVSTEAVYATQLNDMDKRFQQQSKTIDDLSRKSDELTKKNRSDQIKMEMQMREMERTHESEFNELRLGFQQRLKQAGLDGIWMTNLHSDFEHTSKGRNNSQPKEQYRLQQNSHHYQQNPSQQSPITMHSSLGQTQPQLILPLHIEEPAPTAPAAPAAPAAPEETAAPAETVAPAETAITTPSKFPPKKTSESKSARQPLKAISSPQSQSISQSPPISPILPVTGSEKPASMNIQNSPKTKTVASKEKNSGNDQEVFDSTAECSSQTTDLIKHVVSTDSSSDDDLVMIGGFNNGRQWLTNDHHNSKTHHYTPPQDNRTHREKNHADPHTSNIIITNRKIQNHPTIARKTNTNTRYAGASVTKS